jgi:hypothetical protein
MGAGSLRAAGLLPPSQLCLECAVCPSLVCYVAPCRLTLPPAYLSPPCMRQGDSGSRANRRLSWEYHDTQLLQSSTQKRQRQHAPP